MPLMPSSYRRLKENLGWLSGFFCALDDGDFLHWVEDDVDVPLLGDGFSGLFVANLDLQVLHAGCFEVVWADVDEWPSEVSDLDLLGVEFEQVSVDHFSDGVGSDGEWVSELLQVAITVARLVHALALRESEHKGGVAAVALAQSSFRVDCVDFIVDALVFNEPILVLKVQFVRVNCQIFNFGIIGDHLISGS
jgi:hypothetical protein